MHDPGKTVLDLAVGIALVGDCLAEVAAAVVFLASDDAANITGATLSVDGGWSAV